MPQHLVAAAPGHNKGKFLAVLCLLRFQVNIGEIQSEGGPLYLTTNGFPEVAIDSGTQGISLKDKAQTKIITRPPAKVLFSPTHPHFQFFACCLRMPVHSGAPNPAQCPLRGEAPLPSLTALSEGQLPYPGLMMRPPPLLQMP